jgi:hypothetical protein
LSKNKTLCLLCATPSFYTGQQMITVWANDFRNLHILPPSHLYLSVASLKKCSESEFTFLIPWSEHNRKRTYTLIVSISFSLKRARGRGIAFQILWNFLDLGRFHITCFKARISQHFYEGLESKYLGLCRPGGLYCTCSALLF